MAKDRQVLFINNISSDILHNNSLWRTYSYSNSNNKYKHRGGYYTYGVMKCDINGFHIEYLRYSPTKGDLLISYNISILYNGNNSIPKSNVCAIDLTKCINQSLKEVLYTSRLPHYNNWKISKDETNIDIIDTTINIKERFELLKKVKVPHRNLDYSFANDGTLYFHSGRDRNKSSGVIIIYFKGKEQRSRNKSSYNPYGYGNEGLRIEIKNKRYVLKANISKVRRLNKLKNNLFNRFSTYNLKFSYRSELYLNSEMIYFTEANYNLFNKYVGIFPQYERYNFKCNGVKDIQSCRGMYIKDNSNDSNLDIVIGKDYQRIVISDFIIKCGLDKLITAKKKLYEIIDKSNIFSKTMKKTAKRIIRYLNGEFNSIDINDKTIKRYKKLILSTGYHYLYSSTELSPITIDDIVRIIEQDKNLNKAG